MADVRNAQNTQLLYELDAALDRAMLDDSVGAVIIGADGPHFSSGHDLKPGQGGIGDFGPPKMGVGGFRQPGQEGHMAHEQEVFLGFCWRWRKSLVWMSPSFPPETANGLSATCAKLCPTRCWPT